MNLKPIKNYEGLYSFDLNTNQIYSHHQNRYRTATISNYKYYNIQLYKNNKMTSFPLHRLIYSAHYGEIPEGMLIDHIDNNTFNNDISNLRLATRSENNHNRKVNKNNLSSGYKNIRLTKFNTYHVQICKNYKTVYNKTFKTLEEAIENRDLKLKEFHNDFMNTG